MIAEFYQRVRAKLQGRSPKWPGVRRWWLLNHPECAACGATKKLEVHHVFPYKPYPEMELDRANFLTLCDPDHFRLGHARNWKHWVPGVRELCNAIHKGLQDVVTPGDVRW